MAGQNWRVTGGSDQVMFTEAGLLETAGIEVIPFAAQHEENLSSRWSRYFPTGAKLESPKSSDLFRYVYNPQAKLKIGEMLRDTRPDLVHLHIYYGRLTSSVLSVIKDFGLPIVQTLHEYKLVCPSYTLYRGGATCESCAGGKLYNCAVKRCKGSFARSVASTLEAYTSRMLGDVAKIDKFIAVSDFQREQLIKMGLAPSKIVRIYNSVNVPQVWQPSERSDYFLYVGRIEPEKGVFHLVDAFAELPKCRLLIVGSGSAKAALVAIVEKRGLSNISFIDFVGPTERDLLMARARAVIVPSVWYETFGLVAAEALAAGTPVIASRIGGLAEVGTAEDTIQVSPGAYAEIVSAVSALAESRDRADRMGAAGRSNVKRFSAQAHLSELLKVYSELT